MFKDRQDRTFYNARKTCIKCTSDRTLKSRKNKKDRTKCHRHTIQFPNIYCIVSYNQVMENGSINDSITNIIFKETEVPDILIIAQLLDDHTI